MKTPRNLTRIALLGCIALATALPANLFAIANWSRKYGVDCATCHSPAVPRLNAFGHEFRKMGFRMDTEVGKDAKPEAYKELGDWFSLRFRTGFAVENFSDTQAAGADANRFRNRNGFRRPDFTIFYAGALNERLSTFIEIEFDDFNQNTLLGEIIWFGGDAERYYTIRLGQFHTLSRVGWGGFDRPSGISTPDALSAQLTTSPVPFVIGRDQRGIELAYGFTPSSRAIVGVYNGLNFDGNGNRLNGNGVGDTDGTKDVMVAYEQMFGESGFTLFGYYGNWDQKTGTVVGGVALPDDKRFTEFEYFRGGATASWVFEVFDPKAVGLSELNGGYMFAKDFMPDLYPGGNTPRTGHGLWLGVEQRLPHDSAVFYRWDYVSRSREAAAGAGSPRMRHTLGTVYTVKNYLRLAAEVFAYDQSADSFGVNIQAMLNY